MWATAHPKVQLATLAEAAARSEVIINALSGAGSLEGLALAGEPNLAGKIVLDLSNPLDFSKGVPPSLFVSNTSSLGEQLQQRFPSAKIVKTLNTVTANLMVDPGQLAGGDHPTFVAGNDADARRQVAAFLREWFGWRDVIELGDITTARGTEMLLPLWLRTWGALETPGFSLRVVRCSGTSAARDGFVAATRFAPRGRVRRKPWRARHPDLATCGAGYLSDEASVVATRARTSALAWHRAC